MYKLIMDNYHKYLHITSLDRELGFYINTVGYARIETHSLYPQRDKHPADHAFTWNRGRILDGFYIVYITGGRGMFESAVTPPMTVVPGTCFLLFPGIWHRYRPDPAHGWEEYWVGFNGHYPQHVMHRMFRPEAPCIQTGAPLALRGMFRQLLRAAAQSDYRSQQVMSGMVLQLIGLIDRDEASDQRTEDPAARWVSTAIHKLQSELAKPIRMEDLAAAFPISYSAFRKAFKRITGESPNQYHLNLRLSKAEELLKSTNLPVSEIGYRTGFESPFYFSRQFKKKYGHSPKFVRTPMTDTAEKPPFSGRA